MEVQKQVFLRYFVLSRGISSFLSCPQHDVIDIYLHTTLGELGLCKKPDSCNVATEFCKTIEGTARLLCTFVFGALTR